MRESTTRHEMLLAPRPFHMLATGQKTIELRLFDEKRKKVKVGDRIVFYSTDQFKQSIEVEVVALHSFDSFKDLYTKLPLLKCGYTLSDITTAKPEDMRAYYTLEAEQFYGVLGIEVTILEESVKE